MNLTNILITGRPGTGKTTVLNKIKDSIKLKGYVIGGMFCPEIKETGKRVGFSIINIMTNKKGILSHVNCTGPHVGKYKVDMKDLDEIGVTAIKDGVEKADYIFIDEIAPMELYSEKFQNAVEKALDSEKPVLAVIHKKSTHPFIVGIKRRDDVLEFEVTLENRNSLHGTILDSLKK